jgi:hypothetical protein
MVPSNVTGGGVVSSCGVVVAGADGAIGVPGSTVIGAGTVPFTGGGVPYAGGVILGAPTPGVYAGGVPIGAVPPEEGNRIRGGSVI